MNDNLSVLADRIVSHITDEKLAEAGLWDLVQSPRRGRPLRLLTRSVLST